MTYLFSRIALMLICLPFIFGSTSAHAADAYSQQEIEQLVAPVALYPDPLLSQVLMAATYPVEVVEAARWRADQPKKLSDAQLGQMLQDQPWDPSVKSVAAFPDVLNMMNENISWTDQLGDAFLDQQEDVMDAVQRLRTRAQAAGHLQSSPQQVVSASGNPAVITIVPARSDVVYVPIYNPTVIYGAWPYPEYPPYYWHPPRYAVSGPVITFAGALVVGSVLWSSYDWHHHRFHVDVNRYNRFNRTRITSEGWHRDFERRRTAAVHRNSVARDHFEDQRRNNMQAPARGDFKQERRGQDTPSRSSNKDRHPDQKRRSNESGAPRHDSRTERPARPQAQRESQMPSSELHRAPRMERPANITRTPRESGHSGNGYGNRGGGRSETARPREQRQAERQERRSSRHENSGGKGKDRDG
ncbi:DUF3300 domain-containing protein [Eoetvoesiella caeni]